jgi:hypothetical protein
MESPQRWHQVHFDLYEGVVAILIVMVLFGGYFSYRYLRVEESTSSADQMPAPAAYDRDASEDEEVLTQAVAEEAIPQSNPFSDTNPLSSVYENPFE